MKDVLKRLVNTGDVVAVSSDRTSPGHFAVGFVACVDDHDVVMRHISPAGAYDDYSVRRIEDVFRIDVMTVYERTLLAIYRARGAAPRRLTR